MAGRRITSARTTATWLLPALALLWSACEPPPEDVPGSAEIRVATRPLSASDVARVTVTISGAQISPDIIHDLDNSGGQWGGLIDQIPAGNDLTFYAAAHDASETLIYEDTLTGVTVSPVQPVVVLMTLQQKIPPTPFVNTSPVIDGMTVSSVQVSPGEPVALTVTAGDANPGDTLVYSWSATGGAYDDCSSTAPVWTAPQSAGTYTLTVTVSDGRGAQVSLSVEVTVQS